MSSQDQVQSGQDLSYSGLQSNSSGDGNQQVRDSQVSGQVQPTNGTGGALGSSTPAMSPLDALVSDASAASVNTAADPAVGSASPVSAGSADQSLGGEAGAGLPENEAQLGNSTQAVSEGKVEPLVNGSPAVNPVVGAAATSPSMGATMPQPQMNQGVSYQESPKSVGAVDSGELSGQARLDAIVNAGQPTNTNLEGNNSGGGDSANQPGENAGGLGKWARNYGKYAAAALGLVVVVGGVLAGVNLMGQSGVGDTRKQASSLDGCCTSDSECVSWYGQGSTCTNANGACASGWQCVGGDPNICNETCGPNDCGRTICAGTSAEQVCNAGCQGGGGGGGNGGAQTCDPNNPPWTSTGKVAGEQCCGGGALECSSGQCSANVGEVGVCLDENGSCGNNEYFCGGCINACRSGSQTCDEWIAQECGSGGTGQFCWGQCCTDESGKDCVDHPESGVCSDLGNGHDTCVNTTFTNCPEPGILYKCRIIDGNIPSDCNEATPGYEETVLNTDQFDDTYCGLQQLDLCNGYGQSRYDLCEGLVNSPTPTKPSVQETPTTPPTNTPTATVTPNPQLACMDLSYTPIAPALGDTVTFTCTDVGDINADYANFQVSRDGGDFADLQRDQLFTATLDIRQPGNYEVRCQVCVGQVDQGSCSPWQTIAGTGN